MKRYLSLSLLLAASGCGGNGTVTQTDMGAGADLATGGDGSTGGDMAMAATVTGTRVVSGKNFAIEGLTSDDKVVYYTVGSTTPVSAAPLAGGTPVTIDENSQQAIIRGKVVFSFSNVDTTTQVGEALYFANGAAQMYSQASRFGVVDASADGNWVFYSDNAASDGSTTDLVVAKSDGTGAHTIATGVVADSNVCFPVGRFNAAGKLIVSYCAASSADGGATSTATTIAVVDPATGTPTTLGTVSGDSGFALDATGSKILSVDDTGKLQMFMAAGGNPVTIDTGVSNEFAFSPDGNTIVYRTGTSATSDDAGNTTPGTPGAIKKASASATPAPTALVNSGAIYLQFWRDSANVSKVAMSPDGKNVLYSTELDDNFLGDLQLVALAGGAPVTIAATGTKAVLFGDPFVGDKVVFITNVAVSSGGLIGKLQMTPLTGGSPTPISATSTVWVNYLATGTVIVYNDAWKSGNVNNGTADLWIVDVGAAALNSKLLASKASADIYINDAHDKVVFSDFTTGVQPGIYAAPTTP